ncbi:MAG: Co2+/Mg2+ efflux protein ApaG [Gammaproteobacteria bacterium]|nr:Co2+/Mg2+ efflux protein ApaG [Gammaproteobacteria bacterium]MCY4218397.1 Co2+/Mg2+ efflux protein ApaG [Gammaproteobacteria bacterium]MCY4273887.1 Co2+/Mg2+ efflux protein ApaG [Gammaproteobacteria bacterium]
MSRSTQNIDISVKSTYLEAQSSKENNHYVFAYTVNIVNRGDRPAKLLTRHWIITDAHGKVEEVKGPGVVGEFPHLQPGESFEYTSGTIIGTPLGSMAGSYQMCDDDGNQFDAEIPAFMLSAGVVLH